MVAGGGRGRLAARGPERNMVCPKLVDCVLDSARGERRMMRCVAIK